MLWYAVNLFIIFIFILLLLLSKEADKRWSKLQDYLGVVNETINSVRYGNLNKKIKTLNPKEYESLSESINQLVDALNDREKAVIEQHTSLLHQNKLLEAIINSLSDGIVIIDENFKILRATPKVTQWLNLKGKQILDKDVRDYVELPDNKTIDKLENDEVYIKEFATDIFEATTLNLTLDDKKKRYVIIVKNITNQKEIDRLKEDFVATLTHDLKVPIIAEANILDFLLDEKFGSITSQQNEALTNMQRSNRELIELVQILLETYKVKDAGIVLYFEEININPYIKEIIDEMNPIAEKSSIKINFIEDKDFVINADRLQLKRIIKNLIQNGLSHSEHSTTIDIKTTTDDTSANISIIDYGKGVSEEDINMIFKKYYSSARKFRKIGTGLGLYLSQQIAHSHGGEIIVKSEKNVSTEFCIKLPLTRNI